MGRTGPPLPALRPNKIAAQVAAGQDRGCVAQDGLGFAWFSADIFQVRQAADGTWYVFDTVEQAKTHDGYFPARKGAEAELEAILAEAAGSGRDSWARVA